MVAADPANAAAYRANTSAYLAKLETLDRDVREALAPIPVERRKVISTHDAFGYFAAAYDITFVAPQGCFDRNRAERTGYHHHADQEREDSSGLPGKHQ